MADRFISSALEGLQERWKMLTLMHADCLDMLAQWESRRQERLKADRTKRNNDAVKVLVLISVVAFTIGWLIKCCVW
ncbi:unnamed protein product [Lymnaea stagnalis]|uniref:Uncharacterized protein n=1 Tax=Lymnaea stagnalis TaxID=6523 RepID=A0AAV2ISD6_LYMST